MTNWAAQHQRAAARLGLAERYRITPRTSELRYEVRHLRAAGGVKCLLYRLQGRSGGAL